MSLSGVENFIEDLAREAGRLTLRYFRKPLDSRLKEDHRGLVSEADIETEKLILRKIRSRFPSHHILAEESASQLAAISDGFLWMIDPIDGTTNFLNGNAYYCVSIALYEIKNSSAIPVVGCVHQPFYDELYLAKKGEGSFLKTSSQNIQLKLRDSSTPEQGSFGTGFSYNTDNNLDRVFRTIRAVKDLSPTTTIRVNGAAALDLARAAQGVLSGFWEFNLSPWDMGAGQILVREAGGLVTNFNGDDFDPLRDKNILCAPPSAHRLLMDCVQPIFS